MATEDDVRRIALSPPEVTEKPWYNTPGFRVGARLDAGRHDEISAAAVRIEAGQPLLFSFEKMALKDAVGRVQSRRRRLGWC